MYFIYNLNHCILHCLSILANIPRLCDGIKAKNQKIIPRQCIWIEHKKLVFFKEFINIPRLCNYKTIKFIVFFKIV